jgi:hypothetical protein
MSYIVLRTLAMMPPVPGATKKVDSLQANRTILVYLKNTTRHSDNEIAEILEFSMPQGMPEFDATITRRFRDRFRGTCYPSGCWLHEVNPSKPLIIVRTSENEKDFPYWIERGDKLKMARRSTTAETYASSASKYIPKRHGYISTLLRSPQECLVYVTAHELRHLYQAKNKADWVFGSKGRRSSEHDADAYAIAKVREWRRKNIAREVEHALHAASTFLSSRLQRITVLSSIILNRRASIEQ